jgi:hypothetical protein
VPFQCFCVKFIMKIQGKPHQPLFSLHPVIKFKSQET